MKDTILIKNGRLIGAARRNAGTADIVISGGKIVWYGEKAQLALESCDVVDASGMVVCPGFIDLHCHLREPGYEKSETIETGARAAAHGGFTTICCMPNTKPPLDDALSIQRVLDAARKAAINIMPIGCISRGRRGEELADLKQMADAGAAGFSDDGIPGKR